MRAVERLVELGMDPACAVDTAIWYYQQSDEEGLERFVAAYAREQEAV